MTVRESVIETYLVAQAKVHGAEVRKVKWIGRNSAPDRVVMGLREPMIWVELKRPDEVPTAAQLREHDRMRAAGQIVVWLSTKEAVDDFFRKYRK